MEFVKEWVSERSGRRYEIYKQGNTFYCNCMACQNGGSCWQVRKLEAENETARMTAAYRKQRQEDSAVPVARQWWQDYPELVPWNSSARVIKAWQGLMEKMYCVKVYL